VCVRVDVCVQAGRRAGGQECMCLSVCEGVAFMGGAYLYSCMPVQMSVCLGACVYGCIRAVCLFK
jgi:hypothetical protein